MPKEKKIELMAPAGDKAMLSAVIRAGADAVYFGSSIFNMRAKAKNFDINEIQEIVRVCHRFNKKAYLTVNTIIYENELENLERLVRKAKEANVDAIICWDFSVINLCKKYEIPFVISTQASVSNSIAAKFFKELGAKRIVLARECSLEQIREIKKNVNIEIEVFAHGAMCVAISGRCFLSHYLYNKSGNRGDCLQPCRRKYKIIDIQNNNELVIGEDYVLSPKDLTILPFIDKIIEANIDSLKIEGRKRSVEYAAKITEIFRKAIDLYYEGKLDNNQKEYLLSQAQKVYNRGLSDGFYFKEPDSTYWAGISGNNSDYRKEYIGYVENYFAKSNIAHIIIQNSQISKGDKLLIIGNTTGAFELDASDFFVNDQDNISVARKGDFITIKSLNKVRKNDKVYKVSKL